MTKVERRAGRLRKDLENMRGKIEFYEGVS